MTERYYQLNMKFLSMLTDASLQAIEERGGALGHEAASEGSVFKDTLNRLKLQYTAGSSIDALPSLYTDVVDAFGRWHAADREYAGWLATRSGKDLQIDLTPVHFEDLQH